MHITVHLHTILQRETPEGLVNRLEVELPEGATLRDVLARLGLLNAYGDCLPPDAMLLVVNGRMADAEQRLFDGDQVNLMPAISGGIACRQS
ncbi:MAG: MoaD/ThiS family protein [Anaerolineales bacterium]